MSHSKVLANVDSIETMGLVDGPGIRVVVFLQGCHLRCLYCHNPETWSCETKQLMSVEDIVNKVKRYKNYIIDKGGVTFSGGEPLLQSDFIYECCKKLKKENIHVCVDTAGVCKGYEKLIDLVDLFIVDVKSIYEEECYDARCFYHAGSGSDVLQRDQRHLR
jgi:pyruvate formate lyase activating enzyme